PQPRGSGSRSRASSWRRAARRLSLRSDSVACEATICSELGARARHSASARAARSLSLARRAMRVARSARPASPSALRAACRYQSAASSRRPDCTANSPAMVAVRVSTGAFSGCRDSAGGAARQADNSRANGRASGLKRSVTGIWGGRAVKCRPQVQRAYRKRLNAGRLQRPPSGSQPSMSLFALGINHQTAPVALRERIAFNDDAVAPALAGLRALPGVREVALLSTCNRTELYAVAEGDGAGLVDWLATHPAGGEELHAYLYRH